MVGTRKVALRSVLCRTALPWVLLVVLTTPARAEYFAWGKGFGRPCNPEQSSVAVDAAGNIYTAGHLCGTADFDPGPGTYFLTSTGVDPFVSKLDIAGNLVWAGVFSNTSGTSTDHARAVAVDGGGSLYTVGAFAGPTDFDPGPAATSLTPVGNTDAFISKLSSNGGFAWVRQIGGPSEDEPYALALDAAGNVYTAGHFSGTSDFDPGPGTFPLSSVGSGSDVFISKLDGAGDFVWARRMGGIKIDQCFGMAVDSAGNVYTAGTFEDTMDFDPGPGTFNLTSAGGADVFVSKLDSVGNFVWAGRIGGSHPGSPWDRARALTLGADGSVYVVGEFAGTCDFDPGPGTFPLVSSGVYDAFVVKLDSAGNFVWARQFTGTQEEVARSVAVGPSGNVHVVGDFHGTTNFHPVPGTVTLASGDGLFGFVAVLDAGGDPVWVGGLGGNCTGLPCGCCSPGNYLAYDVAVSASGFTHTVGSFQGRMDVDPGPEAVDLVSQELGDNMFVSTLSPVAIPGAVPDGDEVAGVPLTLRRISATAIEFSWGASCGAALTTDYELYEGVLGNFANTLPRTCTSGGATILNITVGAGNRFYLVVPTRDGFEGSYGTNSAGIERPQSLSYCLEQSTASCLP